MVQRPPAMITAKALGAMPAFAMSQIGERGTLRLLSSVGLAEYFIEERHGYIPEHALCEFVSGVSRALGEDKLGLLFSPHLTVEDYDAWGGFVLSAPDLCTALLRAQREMSLHSNTDWVEFERFDNMVSYAYNFGHKRHSSYPDIAYSAVAVMLSIPKAYLGKGWAPSRIEFDFPSDRNTPFAEETYGCPVRFNCTKLRLVFPEACLSTQRSEFMRISTTTRGDIVRERLAPPNTLLDSVRSVVDTHVADQKASLERLALAMDLGPRSLQRQLSAHGTNFRVILTQAKMDRANELLALKGNTVSGVANALGYEEPGNFSRAFTHYFGVSPTRFVQDPL